MAFIGSTTLRCLSSGVLGLLLFAVLPRMPLTAGPAPTPAAVVIADDQASVPGTVALPASWWGIASVPATQVASVPVIDRAQAATLDRSSGIATFRSPPETLPVAREAAARDWAIRTGALRWEPRGGLVGLLVLALASALGASRWSLRSTALIGTGLLGFFGAQLAVVSPLSVLVALPMAWGLADLAFVVSMVVWAEARIASMPTRRPASAPTPLPIAHR
jgi:hypothetical protein